MPGDGISFDRLRSPPGGADRRGPAGGLHQDGEEPDAAPVVTISLGDTCRFRTAGVDRRSGPFIDVDLASGDLLVFGRETRRIFHGVPKVHPGTAPDDLGLPPGRLSITVRQTGLRAEDLA